MAGQSSSSSGSSKSGKKPTAKKSPVKAKSAKAKPASAKKTQTSKPSSSTKKPDTKPDTKQSEKSFDFGSLPSLPAEDVAKLEEVSRNVMQSALKSQKVLSDVMRRSLEGDQSVMPNADPLHAGPDMIKVWEEILSDPQLLMQAQADLYQGYMSLWNNAAKRMMTGESEPAIKPEQGDKRWRSKEWEDHPLFDAIKQSYLLNQKFLMGLVSGVKNVDEHTKMKAQFVTKQIVDAMAPTNFALTNPDVIKATYESKGENLTQGLMNLVSDLERGHGRLSLTQTDMEGFVVGQDLATSPGEVIWRNEVMELIQYAPTTEEVRKRPILFAPPWINKFYILDMREKSSMIRWMTQQGFTVFLISWINPEPSLKDATFEDYIRKGLLTAIDKIEEATGETQVDAIGYCIGGTMLGTALSLMAEEGDKRIASATFFAAQLDFELAGELKVFIDAEWFQEIERLMDAQGGVLDGRTMADTFNMLRSNDLIWSFVINNYLLGRQPQAFDLLYWNADQTRMPKKLHLYYLDTFYRHNKLAKGELEIDGKTLDVSKVKIPVFMQASKEDHIAPAGSVYRSAKLFGGPVQYMMAGSGHIAGVVNHPAANKYQHWINAKLPETLDEWKDGARERPGSWWEHWRDWLYDMDKTMVPAREPGGGKLKSLCPAPGEYVKVRS